MARKRKPPKDDPTDEEIAEEVGEMFDLLDQLPKLDDAAQKTVLALFDRRYTEIIKKRNKGGAHQSALDVMQLARTCALVSAWMLGEPTTTEKEIAKALADASEGEMTAQAIIAFRDNLQRGRKSRFAHAWYARFLYGAAETFFKALGSPEDRKKDFEEIQKKCNELAERQFDYICRGM